MTERDDLVAWLTQIWREQEKAALAALEHEEGDEGPFLRHAADYLGWELAEHIALNGPASVLARIVAERQILADYEDHVATYRDDPTPAGEGQRFGLLLALARLAEGYADHHPGYQEDWRP